MKKSLIIGITFSLPFSRAWSKNVSMKNTQVLLPTETVSRVITENKVSTYHGRSVVQVSYKEMLIEPAQ